jgi:hypothetical protein
MSRAWRMDSIRTSQFPIRKGTKRAAKAERRWWCLRFRLRQATKEKISEAKRRQTQGRVLPRLAGAAAAPTLEWKGAAHLSAFHRGSRPKESFIARDSALGHASWDATNRFGPFRRAGITRPNLSQSSKSTLRPSRSARGLDAQSRPGAGCKAARGRRPRRRDPACLPGRVRLSEVGGVCIQTSDECQRISDTKFRHLEVVRALKHVLLLPARGEKA